eukprot:CAMPEP_0119362466 /NCGR_PEP_ID=MMETSP1334-20130426/9524_1 /TAXON_ID=127549 /ORGANISM="Calcidiscus leptoporus, Strain RCC1130" /LENGTH=67 /DNA_ID=CAMNT_0007377685 /DNA_START=47 /DNA_END=250 /DNA_ORIENTATION=+
MGFECNKLMCKAGLCGTDLCWKKSAKVVGANLKMHTRASLLMAFGTAAAAAAVRARTLVAQARPQMK